MKYFLAADAVLRRLETPSVYVTATDELYELDEDGFAFLGRCASADGSGSENPEFTEYCLEEGILTTEKTNVRRPIVAKSPEPSLRYLELQITDRCNLRCGHCYIAESRDKELSVEQIRGILAEFEEMQGLRLLVTGGEPLLHRQFAEINDMLPYFRVRKALFTNGTLLGREILSGLNVDEIQISIDGLENAHDAVRGKGAFRKAMTAVELAIASGFEVSVATMVHAMNLEDFDAMGNMFVSMGIKDWTVDVPCVAGRLEENTGLRIGPENGGRFLGYGYGGAMHGGSAGFACGPHLMAVSADGGVSKCTFYSDTPMGSIEEGLRVCRERQLPVRLRELKCDCAAIESCRGGCRYRAGVLGDPLGRDLYRCVLYDIIK